MRYSVNRSFFIAAVAVAAALGLGTAAWLARSSDSAGASDASTQAPSALTVEVVAPQTRSWPQVLQASGPVAAWQEIIVSPETGGLRIAELLVDVGSSVRRGQLLARLADATVQAELRKQEAAVAQARASLDQAVSNMQRAKVAGSSGALSAQKIEEYRITGLGHGTPLDTRGSRHGEQAAPFMLDAGISSTHLIGRFWNIVPDQADYGRSIAPADAGGAAKLCQQPGQAAWSCGTGVQKTIEDALRNAGLMK